eukprot:m.37345 g.37345  ORF g.37345 m.37345 type:complete len:355 (+) comp12496_c0_seq1:147-1211(+)
MDIEVNMDAEDIVLIVSASLTWLITAVAGISAHMINRKVAFMQNNVEAGTAAALKASLSKPDSPDGMYSAVCGLVVSSSPLTSTTTSQGQAVLRRRVVEHYHDNRRTVNGRTHRRDISDIVNTTSFSISDTYSVWSPLTTQSVNVRNVASAVKADRIDLNLLSERFEPADSSALAHLASAVGGTTISKGFHFTEEGLAIGSTVTAIGYLTLEQGQLVIGDGDKLSLHVTRDSLADLILRLQHEATSHAFVALAFGLIASGCTYFWFRRNRVPAPNPTAQRLGRDLMERRAAQGVQVDAQEECVVCLDRRPSVLVEPCGHLCLCDACGVELSNQPTDMLRCPVCRGPMDNLRPVF